MKFDVNIAVLEGRRTYDDETRACAPLTRAGNIASSKELRQFSLWVPWYSKREAGAKLLLVQYEYDARKRDKSGSQGTRPSHRGGPDGAIDSRTHHLLPYFAL